MAGSPEHAATLDAGFAPAPAPSVHAVEVGGEAVLLDRADDRLHLLNPSATLLWTCFDGHSTVSEICTDVADALGVPFAVVLADTLALVAQLTAQRLVYDGRGEAPRWELPSDDRAGDLVEGATLEEPPNP